MPTSSRVIVRDAVHCDGNWFVAGATLRADGTTEPALWSSTDARAWTAVPVSSDSYYGRLNVLYSVACRDGVPAALGGKPGGAHGNPRVSTWRLLDGVLSEVSAHFELYGGPTANNVTRMTAGRMGYLMVGNRSTGAAVWTSADASEFELHEGTPGLASEAGLNSWAYDAVAHGDGWTVVGGVIRTGRIDRDPASWTSRDGSTWTRTEISGDESYDEIVRVIQFKGDLVGVGLRGSRFQSWRGAASGWTLTGELGPSAPLTAPTGPRTSPTIGGIAATSAGVITAVSDGVSYRLWFSESGEAWRQVNPPRPLPGGSQRYVAVAGSGSTFLVASDDGQASRLYLASFDGD